MMGLQAVDGAVQEPAASSSSSNLECDFYMYLFKVQPCPKRGAHDWSSCPYAHPKEKARRRDPRVYKYASTPCPESLQGVNCGRGVDCPYAHSVYEYWLHPARFRTQMCKKGNQCNRTLCFFAHSASELRFPDTEDEVEAAAVDAAAASATAGPLPLCHPAIASGSFTSHPGMIAVQSIGGNSSSSLPLMNIGSMCSDASAATATMGTGDNSTSSYSMAALQAAAGSLRQGSCASQLTGLVDDMSGSYGLGGSDPGLLLPGLATQQQQQQVPDGSNSLSEPLPRLGSDPNSVNTAAWLQLATASQLPASQILSSIRSPNASTVAAQQAQQQQQQQLQQQRQLMSSASFSGLRGVASHSVQLTGLSHVQGGSMLLMSGGRGASSHALVPSQSLDSSAEQLVASMNGLQLQGGLVDTRGHSASGIASASTAALADRYAALTAAATASSRPVDPSVLQGSLNTAAAQDSSSSRAEDFLLLQLLQEKQVQQQQQHMARLSNGGNAAVGLGARQNYGAGGMPAVTTAQATGPGQWGFGLGI